MVLNLQYFTHYIQKENDVSYVSSKEFFGVIEGVFTLLEALRVWSIKQTRSVSQCPITDFCVQCVHTLFHRRININHDLPLQMVPFASSAPPDLYCGKSFPAPVLYNEPRAEKCRNEFEIQGTCRQHAGGKVGLKITTEDLVTLICPNLL